MEKPFELAADMLRGKINLEELRSGKKDTESKTIKLTNKIPVFIIYVPVKVVGKKVVFLKDVYGSIK
jgi:murein L,D-transpeptidase YcbB/YkuD